MKSHLKSIALFGLGFAGVVALAHSALQSNIEHPSIAQAVESAETRTAETRTAETPALRPIAVEVVNEGENALASELQGKPTFVKIYADWCAACQRLRPITSSLQEQFGDRVNFVIFDVTDRNTTQEAEARARELGLSDFLAEHRAQTSAIAVIDPSNGEVLEQFRYNFNQQAYVNALDEAIAQTETRS